jgi:hypothetical protein
MLSNTNTVAPLLRNRLMIAASTDPSAVRSAPRTAAIATMTSSGEATVVRSTHHTPPRWPSSSWVPASSARLVLPAPPRPVIVTNRSPSATTASTTSASCASRPISCGLLAGKFVGRTDSVRGGGNAAAPRPSITAQNNITGAGKSLKRCTPTDSVISSPPTSSRASAVNNNSPP